MAQKPVHPLREWRVRCGYTMEAAATLLGSFRQTWHDWENGRRIPERDYMAAIYVLTRGEVRPDHFYQLPDIGERALQLEAGTVPLLEAVADRTTQQSQAHRALVAA